jgi:hypothetical protein
MLSEINQTQKNKYHMVSFRHEIPPKHKRLKGGRIGKFFKAILLCPALTF